MDFDPVCCPKVRMAPVMDETETEGPVVTSSLPVVTPRRWKELANHIQAAVKWLTSSGEDGNQYAQYTLGKLYLLGKDVPKDEEAAVRWFTLSAEQGNEYAQYFLDHLKDFRGPSLFSCATQLLRHMGNIFREQTPCNAGRGVSITDRKLRQRIREKKIAMGHKPDDHAQELTM